MNCKYCDSTNLILEPRIEGQDVATADMVALKCNNCGKWLKWCPKNERYKYITKSKKLTNRDYLANLSSEELINWLESDYKEIQNESSND